MPLTAVVPLVPVDYILFLTADVDVTPNLNEIRDYKYVDKAELQAMLSDSGAYTLTSFGKSGILICFVQPAPLRPGSP